MNNNNLMETMVMMMNQQQQMMAMMVQAMQGTSVQAMQGNNAPVVNNAPFTQPTVANVDKAIVDRAKNEADAFLENKVREVSDIAMHGKNVGELSWKEVSNDKEMVSMLMGFIKEDLRYKAKNPSEYASVLEDFETESLQHYLMISMIGEGTYHPEHTNLEAYDRKSIINSIVELEEDKFVSLMVRLGKPVNVSTKQLEVLKQNGVDTSEIKYWWTASKALEMIFGVRDNNPTSNQLKAIREHSEVLCIACESMPKTKKEASDLIDELVTKRIEQGLERTATDDQKKKFKSLAKELKLKAKDFNCKNQDELKVYIENLGELAIARDIREMQKKYDELHPEANPNQLNFIKNLADELMVKVTQDELDKMTKIDASRKIDELNREKLFRKMWRDNKTTTRDMVKKFSREEVQVKLQEFRA